jgi:hypothetical protein
MTSLINYDVTSDKLFVKLAAAGEQKQTIVGYSMAEKLNALST